MPDAPLILTLALDEQSQTYFNHLRKLHFPRERNYLDAHLTLFHHLPANEPQVIQDIEAASKQFSMKVLQVINVVSIGNGVAFKIEDPSLLTLHRSLQQQWQDWLIPQDQHKLWPHITVQNKVTPDKARQLKNEFEQNFMPFTATGTGLSLWEYQGGPWRFIEFYPFTGS
ncbi:2'-5' RNA ligase family protein [Mucilaginibacter lacusdianchii]|uniref:2'-5' RNA ligase family protein n=1 Tax=Mucilaginibacter lacusdianchii TaxID=2684211 RepID=UPI00131A99D9|nr:2'-5' RNA ligase family protein [Mucilaginibacter sp. JXJ CY 39]